MVNQSDSRDGVPRKSAGRPSPDVERYATDGQSPARGKGSSDAQGQRPVRTAERPLERHAEVDEDEKSGKVGLTSERQSELVAPSGVNERDHGAAEDKPQAGGELNFDDFDELHPRGNTARGGRTWDDPGSDSGTLGPAPGPGLSDTNLPSDPASKRDRRQT